SRGYIAANLAIGAACTVLGAFAGARRAGQLHVRHGGWIAGARPALGVLLSLFESPARDAGAVPLWAEVLAWVLILPAGVAGGALAAALPRAPRRDFGRRKREG